jgi:hypothetical protein
MGDRRPPRDDPSARREALGQRRQELLRDQASLVRAERALEQLVRRLGRGDDEQVERLRADLERQREAVAQRHEDVRTAAGEYGRLVMGLGPEHDPTEQASKLDPGKPLLLLPLRLETRFRATDAGPRLLVRIYPDSCLVDTFEPDLAEAEVDSANRFWADIWRACGDEALERSAWREIVASHGSGRSAWIVGQYQPQNPGQKPLAGPGLLLVVVSETALPAAAEPFWTAMWRAGAELAQTAAARTALQAVVGVAVAALVEANPPRNFEDPPPAGTDRATVPVRLAVVQVPPLSSLVTRTASWSSPPRIDLLPDRFVLVGVDRAGNVSTWPGEPIARPLLAGPDPNGPEDDRLAPEGDNLRLPEGMQWMFEFDRAVGTGMAIVADLTADQAARGFDRLFVLGLRVDESAAEGAAALEELLRHQLHSRTGVELIPQGTPTNNTEGKGAGFAFRDDSDATFGTHFKGVAGYQPEADPLRRLDGEWLAHHLGLKDALVQRLPGAGLSDQLEARAMQAALWPGTLGYTMTSLMAPVFDEDTVRQTRAFFIRHVSGRGPLPALRVGRQPYGIQLTTAFRRLAWFGEREGRADGDVSDAFLGGLYGLIRRVEDDWQALLPSVSHLESAGDADQRLLDVLGLHAASTEYYPLQADSLEQKFHELALFDTTIASQFLAIVQSLLPMVFLRSFGYQGDDIPELLTKIWKPLQTPLTGPVIDDRPLSETEPVRAYASGRNYLQWLAQAARTSLEALRAERGFDGGRRPKALLYLLLRHALQLGYREVAIVLAQQFDRAAAPVLVREPPFIHVAGTPGSESLYDMLYRPDIRITGSQTITLAEHIARHLSFIHPDFRAQIEAVERLAGLPTARLERLFAETLDVCSYRLDAWKTGLLAARLEMLRQKREAADHEREPGAEEGAVDGAAGLHLGFYGWVENLSPDAVGLQPAELPDSIRESVDGETPPVAPLLRDPTNAGFMHAPSINQAATAAVLRSGSLANAGRLAIDLSSRRVRLALEVLDGMRNGQPLGALLGYQFERHVHDHGPLGVQALIYPLRRKYPLAPNRNAETADTAEAQEAIAAQNVVDGRKLIEGAAKTDYPFDPDLPAATTTAHRDALTAALAFISDINDAVADLVLAEGVHQAVLGNYERSAGTLDAFAKGTHPTEPEFIRTPHSGINLTMRAAIHLAAPVAGTPLPDVPIVTPLARAEPAVNTWLARHLPPPATVRCRIHFTAVGETAERTVVVSQADLGLHPLDLVYLAEGTADQALGALEDRLLLQLHRDEDPRLDRPIRIAQTERDGDSVTFFELASLLGPLRQLVTASRPLAAPDLMRINDAAAAESSTSTLAVGRIGDRVAEIRAPGGVLEQLATASAAAANPAVTIDDAITAYVDAMSRAALYRLPDTGIGFAFERRQGAAERVRAKVAARAETWTDRLGRFDAMTVDYDTVESGLTEDERIARLQAAEALVVAQVTAPTPAAAAYRTALNGRKAAFVAKLGQLVAVVDGDEASLGPLVAAAEAMLPLEAFDAEPIGFDDDVEEIERFRGSLVGGIGRAVNTMEERLATVDDLLAAHATSSGDAAVDLVQQAAAALFGEDVKLVPDITLPVDASAEFANASAYSESGQLTDHLARRFPVDDWLHGVARVRDKMHHVETAMTLGQAMGAAELSLLPVQLPFVPGEKWLGLEFAAGATIPSDRLLYTFAPAGAYSAGDPLRGLLIDEWTELIPATSEETGLTFHYDRPNAEPPQSWLLALPATPDGSWNWNDVVDAVGDALDSAKRRAIEPIHLADTPYSWFLPATTSAYTFPEISISNNLLLAVGITDLIQTLE